MRQTLRLALGEHAVPQILTTNRQKLQRENDIAGLFHEGKKAAAARAIDMKLEDGTAGAADGGYQATVERIAELAIEHGANVTAPTNHDALEIGRAIRQKKQASGEIGPDLKMIQCTDGRGRARWRSVSATRSDCSRGRQRCSGPREGAGRR